MNAGDWKDMIVAIQNGDYDLVKYHISQGFDPNYHHPEMLTSPLAESIEIEHVGITELLLKNGADPKKNIGFSKDNAFKIAKVKRNKEILVLIRSFMPKKRWRLW